MKEHEYFEAIKKDDISIVLKNYPKFKEHRSKNPPGLSSLLYAAHENAIQCVKFLKQIENHIRTTEDIVIVTVSISQNTRYTLGKGSTALMIAILRNADNVIKELQKDQIGNRNDYGMTAISFAGLCCLSQPSFEILQNEDYLLEELVLQEKGDSSLFSIMCYFGQLKGIQFFKNKIDTNMISDSVLKLIYRQITINTSQQFSLVNTALAPMNYDKFNTSEAQKVECAKLMYQMIQKALDFIILSDDKDAFYDIVPHWRSLKIVKTDFGDLLFRSENEIIIDNYESQNHVLQALLKDEEDIIRANELDEAKNIKEQRILNLQYRRKLRIQLELSLYYANQHGVKFRKLRNTWFNSFDLEIIQANKQQFRRVLCDDKNDSNGLVLAQIAIIQKNLPVLQEIISEEYLVLLSMNISIKTEFGDCIVPKGSNLLQLAVIVNSEICTPFLLENAVKYRFLGHVTAAGETTFEVSIRSKSKSGNAVLDDEIYLQNELLQDTGGDSIMMKSVKFNNVHMLLKWDKLVLRIEFSVKIFEMCLLKDENGFCMLDLCQSEESARIIENLTKQTLLFIVDNYLYYDCYWRALLKEFLGDQFDDFINLQIKKQKLDCKNLILLEQKCNSLQLEKDIVKNQFEYENQFSGAKESQFDDITNFEVDFSSNKFIFTLKNETIDIVIPEKQGSQYIQDVQMQTEIQKLYLRKLDNSYIFLQRQDNRQSDYNNHVYNGFYPVHYAIYQQNNENISTILEQQLFFRTKSCHYLQAQGIGQQYGIILAEQSSTLQMLLVTGKIYEFNIEIQKIQSVLEQSQFHSYSQEQLQYLDLLIDQNNDGLSILDILSLLKFQKSFTNAVQLILKYFVYKDKNNSNYFDNLFNFLHQTNNVRMLGELQNVFSLQITQLNLMRISLNYILQLNNLYNNGIFSITKELNKKFEQLYIQSLVFLIQNKSELENKQIINQYFRQAQQFIITLQQDSIDNHLFFIKHEFVKQDVSFLDYTIQSVQKSNFFDQIQQNNLKYIFSKQKNYINQKDNRDTNFTSIINGFNPLTYAVYFNLFEMTVQLFNDFKYQAHNSDIVIYSEGNYYEFLNTFNVLSAAIMTKSDRIFLYLVEQIKDDKKLEKLYITDSNQQILTRLAIRHNFNNLFYIQNIVYRELEQESTFIEQFPQTKCLIFEIVQNQNEDMILIFKEFMQKSTENNLLIHSIFKGLIRRIDGYTPMDFISSYSIKTQYFLNILAEHSLMYLLNSETSQSKQLIQDYYFYDQEIIDSMTSLTCILNNKTINKQELINSNFLIDQMLFYNLKFNSDFKNWASVIQFLDKNHLIKLFPKIVYEEQETNLILNIYKGFTQLHYSLIFEKFDLSQYFLPQFGMYHIQHDTFIKCYQNILYLPKGTSALHLAIIFKNLQLIQLILQYYCLIWFNVQLDVSNIRKLENFSKPSSKQDTKQKTVYFYTSVNTNTMPIFEFSLTLCALISEIELPQSFIHAELSKYIETGNEQQIYNLIFAIIKYKNFHMLKIVFQIIKDIDTNINFRVLCYLQQQKFIIKHNIIQQMLSITQQDSLSYTVSDEFILFVQNEISQFNNYIHNFKVNNNYNLSNLYNVNTVKLLQAIQVVHKEYQSPIVLKQNYPQNFIINDQQYKVTKDQCNIINNIPNALEFQIQFEVQSKYQSEWFDRVKVDDTYVIIHQLQQLIKSYDLRPTIYSENIFYGWSGIHYAACFGSCQIIQYLAKFEAQLLTKCDQIVKIKKQIFFIPKGSNSYQIACIVRNNAVLDILIQSSTKIQKQFQNNSIYLDMMQKTGLFNEEIGDQQDYSNIDLTNFLNQSVKMNNYRFVEYLFNNYIKQDEFYVYVLQLIQSDVLPPEQMMNNAQLFIYEIFPIVERETYQNLSKFQGQLIQIYGIDQYNQQLENYRIGASNTYSLTTTEKVKKISCYQNDEFSKNQPNQWFDAVNNNNLAKISQLKNYNTYDQRDTYYSINQYNGFAAIHYALLFHLENMILHLLKYEFFAQINQSNIVNIDNQAILVTKGTSVIQLAILTKQIHFIAENISEKYQKLINQAENLQFFIVADLFPDDFLKIFSAQKDNFINQIYENQSLNFESQLLKFIESSKINMEILQLFKFIFTSCSQIDQLFLAALECCNSNINIKSVQNLLTMLKFDSFNTYLKNTRNLHFNCNEVPLEQLIKNKMIVENFKQPENHSIKDEFFDAIIANDYYLVLETYKQNLDRVEKRKSTAQVIENFNPLFYAVFYKIDELTTLFGNCSNMYKIDSDITLPTGLFLSKYTSITSFSVLIRNEFAFNNLKKIEFLDIRGFNFVQFAYLFDFKSQECFQFLGSLSIQKLFLLVKLSRRKELTYYIADNFSSKQLLGMFCDDLEKDFVGQWLRNGWVWQDQKVRIESRQGVKKILFSGK